MDNKKLGKIRWGIKGYINEYQGRSTSVHAEFDFEEKRIEIQTDLAQEPGESFRAYGYSGAGTYTDYYTIEQFIVGRVVEGILEKEEKEEKIYWTEELNPYTEQIFEYTFLAAFAEYIAGNYYRAILYLDKSVKNAENEARRTFVEECFPFFKQKLD